MFRRREDSDTLFDTHAEEAESGGSAASFIAPPAPQQPAHSSQQAANRPLPDARPAMPQTANAFRPGATTLGDIPRNRMPEPKSTMTPSNPIAPDKSNKSGKRVLTVGNDILLKGEIATCDRLVIEGKVDATLNDVHTVEIAESGSFKGAAHIEDAEISGLFEGDLIVRNRLVIYATGKVRGKITYGEIEIQRGGELSGEIKTNSQPGASSRPARQHKDDKVAA